MWVALVNESVEVVFVIELVCHISADSSSLAARPRCLAMAA
ncbi:MAG: hypothetical protein QM533_12870 [Cytophagales bacterium]|nr:hypothetical protein [Cytophagales bacterium]